ncbi:hypothetical protein Dda_3286 [Drechslerella dactyloides]|uniref:Uncharacterized protein n=1 Tax=Drechslerella dactyloides TaxID=74499 RepID=A0AAD6NLD3_DREDA|nr:hypothetical protein Dda_3286 [Drechslerella dactyloides]
MRKITLQQLSNNQKYHEDGSDGSTDVVVGGEPKRRLQLTGICILRLRREPGQHDAFQASRPPPSLPVPARRILLPCEASNFQFGCNSKPGIRNLRGAIDACGIPFRRFSRRALM